MSAQSRPLEVKEVIAGTCAAGVCQKNVRTFNVKADVGSC